MNAMTLEVKDWSASRRAKLKDLPENSSDTLGLGYAKRKIQG